MSYIFTSTSFAVHSLKHCSSLQSDLWLHIGTADALKSDLHEAKAEAQRVRDCQAELTRQHQVSFGTACSKGNYLIANSKLHLISIVQTFALPFCHT